METYLTPEDESRFEPSIVCGLQNLGNTCYLNSGLQSLMNVGPFLSALTLCATRNKKQQDRALHLIRPYVGARALHGSFLATMQQMVTANPPVCAPDRFIREVSCYNPQFEGRDQQDSHELIMTVLSAVEDDTRLGLMSLPCVASSLRPPAALSQEELTPGAASIPDHSSVSPVTTVSRITRPANSLRKYALSSLRSINAIALADEVARTEELRQRQLNPTSSYVKPLWHRSAPADVFRGLMLHEITCTQCHTSFRRVDPFNSLSVAIPSYQHRVAYRREQEAMDSSKSPKKSRRGGPGAWIWSFLTCIWRTLCMCIFDESGSCELGTLTLDECLGIHFSREILKGSNRYHCDVCKGKSIASHRWSILQLPEVLILQLKRFEGGWYWTHKKGQHVSFPASWTSSPDPQFGLSGPTSDATPLDGESVYSDRGGTPGAAGSFLDMAPYCADPCTRKDPAQSNPTSPSHGTMHSRIVSGKTPLPFVSTYSLDSLINHHGTFFGGHYTAYVNKPGLGETPGSKGWVLFNDRHAMTVDPKEVAESQAYILVYRRQPLVQEPPEMLRLRTRAREYLLGTVSLSHTSVRYISRLWLHRVACYADPGPIMNLMCYCDEGDRQRCLAFGEEVGEGDFPADESRHFHGSVEWFYVPVTTDDWALFTANFGGGPEVRDEDFNAWRVKESRWIEALQRARESAERNRYQRDRSQVSRGVA